MCICTEVGFAIRNVIDVSGTYRKVPKHSSLNFFKIITLNTTNTETSAELRHCKIPAAPTPKRYALKQTHNAPQTIWNTLEGVKNTMF